MALIPTSFLRTAQLRLTPRSSTFTLTRNSFQHSQNYLRTPNLSCRSFHASTPTSIKPSHVSKVRNYYGNRGSGQRSGFFGRIWETVDRLDGKKLVYGIIGLDIAIFGLFQISQGPETPHVRAWLRDNMTSSIRNIKEGRVWTLVTSAFAHASMDHLLFNMLGLWMFCPSVAVGLGSAAFLQVYLAGSIGCDIFSLFWNRNADPRRASLGASGALCAIMSFTACLAPKSTVLLYGIIPMPLWGCVAGIFLYDLYGSQRRTGSSSTDFAGHIGGTLTGVGLYLIRHRLGIRRSL